jgi:hypothetical protein
MAEVFADRREAGRLLAERLLRDGSARPGETVVLALPRGGVPVGYEVAAAAGDTSHADRIAGAVTLRVDRAAEGVERGLEIGSQGGEVFRVRFRSAVPPELVDGDAPGFKP